jgi:hypothetical protein
MHARACTRVLQVYAAVELRAGSIAKAQWTYALHFNLTEIPDTNTLQFAYVLNKYFNTYTQHYSYADEDVNNRTYVGTVRNSSL